ECQRSGVADTQCPYRYFDHHGPGSARGRPRVGIGQTGAV
ncbi:MAG: hypothetical protein AVDCRST_MAG54-4146, partial [uncultured Actinomycetospora sp.]